MLAACSGQTDSSSDSEVSGDNERVASASNAAEVTVMKLEPRVFSYDIVSNGRAAAARKADLSFDRTDAPIATISVRNGQSVADGQVIAILDSEALKRAADAANADLERAKLELADALIGQGYDPDRPEAVPEAVMSLARLRSGMAQAEIALADAHSALDHATLRAPFSGVVANLTQKAGNRPDPSEPFCRVIASGDMEVEFPVLESELALIAPGAEVECSPYAGPGQSYSGRVTEINPVVDEDGMVRVVATVAGGNRLFDGMNLRVSVKRRMEEALVVPKSAVVMRSGGRKVVFTLQGDKAAWNYVTTSLENMDEYVIAEGLDAGVTVITGGNINLSHEAPVRVVAGVD